VSKTILYLDPWTGISGDMLLASLLDTDRESGRLEEEFRRVVPSLGLAEADFVVGYIGTLGMAHGLANVLEAAAECPDDVRFLIVGTGAERTTLVAEAERRRLCNVIFVPPQPKQRIAAYWSLCDVALVHLKNAPLFATVIPSKIFEAMGMGLPVLLVSPRGEASSLIEREGVGIWVPAGDPGRLRQAVLLLRSNPNLRANYAERSRVAAPRYSRERQAAETLKSLQLALGRDRVRILATAN